MGNNTPEQIKPKKFMRTKKHNHIFLAERSDILRVWSKKEEKEINVPILITGEWNSFDDEEEYEYTKDCIEWVPEFGDKVFVYVGGGDFVLTKYTEETQVKYPKIDATANLPYIQPYIGRLPILNSERME